METDININNNNIHKNKKKINIVQNKSNNLLSNANKNEGNNLLKKAKLININDIHNNKQSNLVTEVNPIINIKKERKNLSKNSSSSKNKININIKTIHEKNIDKMYNNEEKNDFKLDDIIHNNNMNKNIPPHKKGHSRKNNIRLKELQKYFNDLGINEAYKLYIPQLNIVSPNNNNSNSNFNNANSNIKNLKNINTKKVGNRYGQLLPNLYPPNRIRKNNSNSLNHYDNAKNDLMPKPMVNRKFNLLLNKKFGIKLI